MAVRWKSISQLGTVRVRPVVPRRMGVLAALVPGQVPWSAQCALGLLCLWSALPCLADSEV